MRIHQILGISLLCVSLYFTTAHARCDAFTVVVSSCVKSFAIANKEAKDMANSRTCPTDKLTDSCVSFRFLKKCLGEEGNTNACAEKVESEFKNEGFSCTLKEVEDAVGTCDASLTSCSILVLVTTVIWTGLSTL